MTLPELKTHLAEQIALADYGNTMKTVTESIYNGKTLVAALADVQHVEKRSSGLMVITSKTHYDFAQDDWSNPLFVPNDESEAFLQAWRRYRAELESATIVSPDRITEAGV